MESLGDPAWMGEDRNIIVVKVKSLSELSLYIHTEMVFNHEAQSAFGI